MEEPASKSFVFDAEGTADLMSGLRADLADLDYVASAFLLFATGVAVVPFSPERLGAIRPLLVRRERMEHALTAIYSASLAGHHSVSKRYNGSYRERAHFSNEPRHPSAWRPVALQFPRLDAQRLRALNRPPRRL